MTITEAVVLRAALEVNLRSLLWEFELATGVELKGVDLEMLHATEIGTDAKARVRRVRVRVEL